MTRREVFFLSLFACGACGGSVTETVPTNSPSDASTWTAPLDGSVSVGPFIGYDAGVCGTGEPGYFVCGGTNNCFLDASQAVLEETSCEQCSSSVSRYPDAASLCFTPSVQGGMVGNERQICTDGNVRFEIDGNGTWIQTPFAAGEALFLNGVVEGTLRYCDWSLFNGTPLPLPDVCPTFSTFSVCGGACGTCGPDDLCYGRSPDHPLGLCVSQQADECNSRPCVAGKSCLEYLVDGGAVDSGGWSHFCVPSDSCADLEANYPGGALCLDASVDGASQ